jgi:hypothetical protein
MTGRSGPDPAGTPPLRALVHSDEYWHQLKAGHPEQWAGTAASGTPIRHGSARANAQYKPLRGAFFQHRQRTPLSQVTLRAHHGAPAETGCGPFSSPAATEAAEDSDRGSEAEGAACSSGIAVRAPPEPSDQAATELAGSPSSARPPNAHPIPGAPAPAGSRNNPLGTARSNHAQQRQP